MSPHFTPKSCSLWDNVGKYGRVRRRDNIIRRMRTACWITKVTKGEEREKNQQDATNLMFIIKLLSQHVSGIIMSIIRRTRVWTAAYGVLHWLWWLWLCGAGTRAVCIVKVIFNYESYLRLKYCRTGCSISKTVCRCLHLIRKVLPLYSIYVYISLYVVVVVFWRVK